MMLILLRRVYEGIAKVRGYSEPGHPHFASMVLVRTALTGKTGYVGRVKEFVAGKGRSPLTVNYDTAANQGGESR